MLRLIYIVLVVINLLLFLLTQRKISYLLIYYLSSCLYYVSAIFGYSFLSSNNHISGTFMNIPVNTKTYIIMIINMFCILIFLLLSLMKKKTPVNNDLKSNNDYYDRDKTICEKYAIKVVIIINMIIAILFVLPSMNQLVNRTFDKADLLEESSSFVSYFKAISTFLLVYLFTQKNIKYSKFDYLSSIIFILFTLLLGHRSYLVISILGIVIFNMNNKKNNDTLLTMIRKNRKKVLIVVILFFLFIISKNIYTSLLNGNYDLVISRLKDSNYYINSFKQNEFNTIFVNLDTIVKYNYTFPLSNYIRAILVFVPFVNRFISIEKFSLAYQRTLFNTNIRASTFLGEAYACGGFALTIIIIILVLLLLTLFDKKIISSKSNVVRTFFILSAVDFSFYIHRNSLEIAFSRIRFFLYIIIFIGIMKLFLNKLVKK